MGIRVARAAGKKLTKRTKRRKTARRKRAAVPRAKPARRRAARPKRAARATKRSRSRTSARAGAARRTAPKAAARKRARPEVKPRTKATGRAQPHSGARAAVKPRAAARPVTARPPAARPRSTAPAARPRAARPRSTAPSARPRAAAAPPPVAFAAQRALATAREELLLEIQRSRASVKAAIQGLTAANAERPLGPGKWSIKEIVLHLSERDRVRLEEFSRTLGGLPRTWAGMDKSEEDAVNELHLAPLRAHGWDAAVKRLDSQRELLLLRLSEVPALPDDVWRRGHPFADMMWGLPEHDRHHAGQIKQARTGELLPMED